MRVEQSQSKLAVTRMKWSCGGSRAADKAGSREVGRLIGLGLSALELRTGKSGGFRPTTHSKQHTVHVGLWLSESTVARAHSAFVLTSQWLGSNIQSTRSPSFHPHPPLHASLHHLGFNLISPNALQSPPRRPPSTPTLAPQRHSLFSHHLRTVHLTVFATRLACEYSAQPSAFSALLNCRQCPRPLETENHRCISVLLRAQEQRLVGRRPPPSISTLRAATSIMSFHPQTPQSPSQSSPGTSELVVSAASAATSMATTATTLPTPAHSVNGSASQLDAAMPDDSPQKRKRSLDDMGDREQKKVHLEESKLGIEDLHLDVGKKYLLCQTPHPESLPRTSEDLYEMFDLIGLAAEVAREKPNGEKNALRKTYKGHIKRLGVSGHFDVSKKEENAPSDFMSMLQVPDLEWNVHEVKGREIADGLSEITLSGLERAMSMAKGPISKNVWDASVLGDLAPSTGDPSKQTLSARPTAPNTPIPGTPNPLGRLKPQGPPGQDPVRPRRNIKKRSYGDSSFDGYEEGFPDDVDTGYSTGEGEGQKRRKKVILLSPTVTCKSSHALSQNPGSASPYPSAMRQQSYGPGLVGA
ncbi:hypothetical protein G7046_g6737 [Stylonectria norvegica]|nr:hypothetical protein G7046_g6737 [Stylonectria norvegica]